MSAPTARDREEGLIYATDMKDWLWLIAQTLRRTSGSFNDPLDPRHKRKRELTAEDWAEIVTWLRLMDADLKRLLGKAYELSR